MSVEFQCWCFSFYLARIVPFIMLWSCSSLYLFYVLFSRFYLLQIQAMFTVMTEAICFSMRLISPLLFSCH